MGIWLSWKLYLKCMVEACAVYVFPLILYRLAVLPLPKARRLALQRSHSRLFWIVARPMVRRLVCIQRTRNGVWVCYWLTERLAYLGRSLTRDAGKGQSDFSLPQIDVGLWAKHCLSASAERPFVTFIGQLTFHGLGRSYIGS